jgi:hypothetical protein
MELFQKNPWSLVLYLILMPALVILFNFLGWGDTGIIVAVVGSITVGTLLLLIWNRIRKSFHFESRKEALAFFAGASDLITVSKQSPVAMRARTAPEADSDYIDGEIVTEETSMAIAPRRPAALPTPPERLPENRFRLVLGDQTLELTAAYTQMLMYERLRSGTKGVLRVLLEELARPTLHTPFLLVDQSDAFLSLMPELGEFGYVLSSVSGHQEMVTRFPGRFYSIDLANQADMSREALTNLRREAWVFGQTLLQHGWQVIFRFSSYEPGIATEILLAILQGMQKYEQVHVANTSHPAPVIVAIPHAYQFVPGDWAHSIVNMYPELARKLQLHLQAYLDAQGMYGIYLYLVTEKLIGMSSDALKAIGLWWLKDPSAGEYQLISQHTGLSQEDLEETPTDAVVLVEPGEEEFFFLSFRHSRTVHEEPEAPSRDIFEQTLKATSLLSPLAAAWVPAPRGTQNGSPREGVTTESLAEAQCTIVETEPLTVGPKQKDFSAQELAWASYILYARQSRRRTVDALNDPLLETRGLARALGFNIKAGNTLFHPRKAHRLYRYVKERLDPTQRRRYINEALEQLAQWEATPQMDAASQQEGRAEGKPGRGSTGPPSSLASGWNLPSLDEIFLPAETLVAMDTSDDADFIKQELADLVQETLRELKVLVECRPSEISIGPTVIRIAIRPTGRPEMMKDEQSGLMVPARDAKGRIIYEERTSVKRIMAQQHDLALILEAKTTRMEAPVPGRPYVGLEIPNPNSRIVPLREIFASPVYQTAKAKSLLVIALGLDLANEMRIGDIARMPHLLIAGATGAGKSVALNVLIASLLMQATPDDVRFLFIDPKLVELSIYAGIPHLLAPVVTDMSKVGAILANVIREMERRYHVFAEVGVRNLEGYRKKRAARLAQGDMTLAALPSIIIVIDELADLMMAAAEEVEGQLQRLTQLARATGIHLVIATQRPSVDVITGIIKANIPTRISFMVSSAVDSRIIIDMGGAEQLLGRGDMLYLPVDAGRPDRIQGAFLSDEQAERLAEWWRTQAAELAMDQGEPFRPQGIHQLALAFDWTSAASTQSQAEEIPAVVRKLVEQQPSVLPGTVIGHLKDYLLRGTRYKDGVRAPDGVLFPFPLAELSFEDQLLAAEVVLWRMKRGSATLLRTHLGGGTPTARQLRDTLIARELMDQRTQQPLAISDRLATLLQDCGLQGNQGAQDAEELVPLEEEETLDEDTQETTSISA